ALLFARAAWLGQPAAIPLHQLSNGAFLIFAFFMISDPKTTPDSRAGRILFAGLVALGACFVTFVLYRPNGLLYALAAGALLVPLLDRLLPGERFAWRPALHPAPRPTLGSLLRPATAPRKGTLAMNRSALTLLAAGALSAALAAPPAFAFCGFYVAKADTKLWNQASQVVLVRDDDRTVLTMANDFKGDPKEFAIVIPVPTVIRREQIHVANKGLIDHLDAYSAPRLVEYFDENPCAPVRPMEMAAQAPGGVAGGVIGGRRDSAKSLGVRIEASYTVGEYDILILSAEQSHGLETWLVQSGYRIPPGASGVLGSYIKQGMKFFVAKVNLKQQSKLGFSSLRPLQVAYTSPKFMLPIRLGIVNADGAQELFVFALTRKGRVETTNYRTVRLPSGDEIPLFVKDEFGDFYKAMFARQVRKEDRRAVFLEYAWDMSWCDPCAAEPLSRNELGELGVFWLRGDDGSGAQDVFLSRLHVRYDGAHFPEDLVFQQTADRENFQGRYVLRHPWTGSDRCEAAREYRRELARRSDQQSRTLAELTGWDIAKIRGKMNLPASSAPQEEEPWWKQLWKD
ncbi:MAG TPA: DUF2330 domain-containing protein, partial [Thermoanaerobaculia bacterium]|nr:DUF2330 domain-containing protein [Thermoanaerobaculia bacterium]